MIDIRESVFETNSSSEHALTICTKSLKDMLISFEAFYLDSKIIYAGSDACEDFSVCKLLDNPDCFKTRADVLDELRNWLKEYKYLKDEEKPWIEKLSLDTFDEFVKVHEDLLRDYMYDLSYAQPDSLFGSNDGDDYVLWEDEYPMANNSSLTLTLVSRAC